MLLYIVLPHTESLHLLTVEVVVVVYTISCSMLQLTLIETASPNTSKVAHKNACICEYTRSAKVAVKTTLEYSCAICSIQSQKVYQ